MPTRGGEGGINSSLGMTSTSNLVTISFKSSRIIFSLLYRLDKAVGLGGEGREKLSQSFYHFKREGEKKRGEKG